MKKSWYAELEFEHGEQLVLLERIEAALLVPDLDAAREMVAELDRRLAEHLAYEEEVLRASVERHMLPVEVDQLEQIEREHAGMLGGMTSLRYAVGGVTPGANLQAAIEFLHAFRKHTLDEQLLLRAVQDRLASSTTAY